MTRKNIIMFVVLVAIGVFGRLMPHAWNFTPLIATTLFAGVYLGPRYALVLPIVTMLLSDMLIGFYNPQIMMSVYISFALAGLLGHFFAKDKKVNNIILSALVSSALFFLITNGAVWLFGTMYNSGISGLAQSYIAGIPFYRNMMLGDVVYSLSLFGLYETALFLVKKCKTKKISVVSTQI